MVDQVWSARSADEETFKMEISSRGSVTRLKHRPVASSGANQSVVKVRSLWRLPSAAAKSANQPDDEASWPPAVMLIFAGCLSFLLWAGIVAAIIWAHRALGWF
jgi:hypothetical protein